MKRLSKFLFCFALALFLPALALVGCKEKPANYYVVSFCDEEQNVLEYVKVKEGEKATYSLETPTKEQEEGCSFTFLTWVDANGNAVNLQNVKSDLSVYPKFKAESIAYTITIPERVLVVDENGNVLRNGGVIFCGTDISVTCNVAEGKSLQYLRANSTELKNGQTYTIKGDTEITFTEKNFIPELKFGTYLYTFYQTEFDLVSSVESENLITFIDVSEQYLCVGTNYEGLAQQTGTSYAYFENVIYDTIGNTIMATLGEIPVRATLTDSGMLCVSFPDFTGYFVLVDNFDETLLAEKVLVSEDGSTKITFNVQEKKIVIDTWEEIWEDRDEDGSPEAYDVPVQINMDYDLYGMVLVCLNESMTSAFRFSHVERDVNDTTINIFYLGTGAQQLKFMTQEDWDVCRG